MTQTLDHCGGVKRSFFFFSENGHVTYQTKEEEVQTYMQDTTLSLHTPLTSGDGFNGQLLKLCRCKYTFSLNKTLKHTWQEAVMI